MHRTTRLLAAPALLATLALTGCGEESSPAGDAATPAPTSSAPPASTSTTPSAPATSASKASIDLTVTGGIAGIQQRYFLAAGNEPAKAFTLAQSAAVKAFQGKHINPRVADGFVYTLTIHQPDGSVTSIVTNDGAAQPPEVQHLIALLRDAKLLQPKTPPPAR